MHIKTEHSGAKHGNGAFYGTKRAAKTASNKARRQAAKAACKGKGLFALGAQQTQAARSRVGGTNMDTTMPKNGAEELLLTPDPEPTFLPAKLAGRARTAPATADALGLLREWAKVFTLSATHCACCGKDLRDALSVTRGIGPDCSREHYEIDFEITEDMAMRAMGRVLASHLDDRVKRAVRDLNGKPRDLCNILVWWSAVNLNKTETVVECAEIVTLLGFVSLGDRLRERNTNVIITKAEDGDFILRCKSKHNVVRNMRRVAEATPVAREGRFKLGWKFPASRKELVWAILGQDFGQEWATVPAIDNGPSRVVRLMPKTYWEVEHAFRATYLPPAPITHVVVAPTPTVAPAATIVRVVGNGIEVHTPTRNWAFVSELKLLPGKDRRWNPDQACWWVAPSHEAKVRALVATHFNGAV